MPSFRTPSTTTTWTPWSRPRSPRRRRRTSRPGAWWRSANRLRRLSARHDRPLAGADHLESTFLGFLAATLAAQNAIVAAASLGLGTVCVGAMRKHPEVVAAELGLPPGTFAVFGLAVGRPDPSEKADVKPRLPRSAGPESLAGRDGIREALANLGWPSR